MNEGGWPACQERWRRFEAWENAQLRGRPPDYAAALAWMSEAWELARRYDPRWGTTEHCESHRLHHSDIQAALARAHLAP